MPEHNNYSNIDPSPCPEQCQGCSRRTPGNTCNVYALPEMRWTGRPCPMATHMKKEEKKTEVHVDPIKASKRSMRKK
jgi:hypothetical protein